MFNENSGLVKVWVNLIKRKLYTLDDVPYLDNLRDVVASVINEGEGA
jgi:hypothetical protein